MKSQPHHTFPSRTNVSTGVIPSRKQQTSGGECPSPSYNNTVQDKLQPKQCPNPNIETGDPATPNPDFKPLANRGRTNIRKRSFRRLGTCTLLSPIRYPPNRSTGWKEGRTREGQGGKRERKRRPSILGKRDYCLFSGVVGVRESVLCTCEGGERGSKRKISHKRGRKRE